ncbi:sigma-70 family RNA polymerase sigma factor [Clostridium sp.]|uniref:sigma-70 family RNA polymerase sigma factor n=1 Tax=Clostridium sp. TaxID=1506 RepID=UPI002FC9F513
MEINSENLIKELKNRNENALDYLYDNYLGLAYKISQNTLGGRASREDIEECVSDIFIGVWNNINSYDESITTFKSWFGAVCKYKSVDYLRRLKVKEKDITIEALEIVDPLTVEDKILISQDISALKTVLNGMGEVDRSIFIKRYILNENIPDICSELGINRGTVDNRLSRGRKAIKSKWLELTGRQCYEQR